MLDVGFSEILLTSAIALIVLGPEKLPKVARQVGNWVGRARAMARQLTEQLEREVSAEELMKQTKSTASGNPSASPSSAPASFDTSYVPNDPPPAVVAVARGGADARRRTRTRVLGCSGNRPRCRLAPKSAR